MMNEVFANMKDIMVIYIDDFLIFTKTNDQDKHNRLVYRVLLRLEENDLFVKPEKCFFSVNEVEFLGMTVCVNGIQVNDEKSRLSWNGQNQRLSEEQEAS